MPLAIQVKDFQPFYDEYNFESTVKNTQSQKRGL